MTFSLWMRRALLAAASGFGIVVAARTLHGPFDAPFPLHSPLNAEAWFGLLLTVLLLWKREAEVATPVEGGFGRFEAMGVAALAVIIATCYARALGTGFLSDDFVLLTQASQYHWDLRAAMTTGGGDGFFRPVFQVWLAVVYRWAAWEPVRWHVVQLLVHFANSLLVFRLGVRVCGTRFAALLAAALFAVHGTRPEAAAWVAGCADLLATLFTLMGILCFLETGRDRRGPPNDEREWSLRSPLPAGCLEALEHAGWRRYGLTFAALTLMVLAIWSKEAAYPFPVLALCLVAKRRELRALVPFFAVAGALFVHRWFLFQGIGGYKDVNNGESQVLTFGLLPSLKVLGMRLWAILYFPINWSAEPGVWLGIMAVAYVACLLWLGFTRRARASVMALGFLLIAALPPLHQLLIGQDLEKSRLLYLPAVGFCWFLGSCVYGRWRWVAACVLVGFQARALEHNLGQRAYVAERAQQACAVAAGAADPQTHSIALEAPLPGTLHGVYFFANGFPECVDRKTGFPVTMPISSGLFKRLRWDPGRDELNVIPSSIAK